MADTPTSSIENVKLGVCSITFDGVDLGFTKGGVDVEVATTTKAVTVEQFGEAPINEYITSRTCTVKTNLAETTLENLVKVMPGATLVSDAGTPAKKKVKVTSGVGTSLLTLAKKLVLHPIANAEANKADDFTIPLAGVKGDMNFSYKLDDERVFAVTFSAYPDLASKLLFVVGDSTVAG